MPERKDSELRDWAKVARGRVPRRPARRPGRPLSVNRLRSFIARTPLWMLVALFAGAVVAFGFVAAVGYELTEGSGPDRSFPHWWLDAATAFTANPVAGATEEGSAARHVVQALTVFGGAVLSAGFLGAIVFRLLITPDVFVFRNRISVVPNARCRGMEPEDGAHLAIRLYNGSALRVVDLETSVHLHTEQPTADGYDAGYEHLEIARNERWPLAHEHIPFTIRLPLRAADADAAAPHGIRAIQGHVVTPGDFLMVTVRGRAPELGTELVEVHVYDIPGDLTTEPPGVIDHDPRVPSHEWRDWDAFDPAA